MLFGPNKFGAHVGLFLSPPPLQFFLSSLPLYMLIGNHGQRRMSSVYNRYKTRGKTNNTKSFYLDPFISSSIFFPWKRFLSMELPFLRSSKPVWFPILCLRTTYPFTFLRATTLGRSGPTLEVSHHLSFFLLSVNRMPKIGTTCSFDPSIHPSGSRKLSSGYRCCRN